MGLVPAGDDGTYFQTVPYKTRTLDTMSVIAVGGTGSGSGTDWLPSSREPAHLQRYSPRYTAALSNDTQRMISPSQAEGSSWSCRSGDQANFRAAAQRRRCPARRPSPRRAGPATPGPRRLSFLLRPRGFVDDPMRRSRRAGNAAPALRADLRAGGGPDVLPAPGPAPGRRRGQDRSPSTSATDVEPMPYPSRNVVAILPGATRSSAVSTSPSARTTTTSA